MAPGLVGSRRLFIMTSWVVQLLNNAQTAADARAILGIPVVSDTAPENPAEGLIWYDSINKHWKGWNGTAWKQLDN